MSVRNNRNPFGADEDNEDDFKFGNKTASTTNYNNSNSNFRKPANSWANHNDDDNNLEQIQQKIGKVENDSLESTQRALRMLNETHDIGVNAAQVILSY